MGRDGKTSSKEGWEGVLGKQLKTVQTLDRAYTFPAIPGKTELPDLPEKVVKDLSSDQHYSYRIAKAVRQGKIDEDLAALTVGKTGHSRWLTTANLFCDWWCRKHVLKGKLFSRHKDIVSFIGNVYFLCWFRISISNSCID